MYKYTLKPEKSRQFVATKSESDSDHVNLFGTEHQEELSPHPENSDLDGKYEIARQMSNDDWHNIQTFSPEVAQDQANVRFSSPKSGVVSKLQRQVVAMQPACRETGAYAGNQEHVLIENDYKRNVNSNSAIEFSIPGSGERGGDGRADIVDLRNHAIYEIKTYLGAPSGVIEAARYRSQAQTHCDPNAIWQIGNDYPKRVIPFGAENELVCQQYENYPGVIVYYERKRKRKQKKNEILPEIVRLVKRVTVTHEDVNTAVRDFLIEHPEVKKYLIETAVGIAIATIVQDILTAGAGVLDNPISVSVVWALVRAALM